LRVIWAIINPSTMARKLKDELLSPQIVWTEMMRESGYGATKRGQQEFKVIMAKTGRAVGDAAQ